MCSLILWDVLARMYIEHILENTFYHRTVSPHTVCVCACVRVCMMCVYTNKQIDYMSVLARSIYMHTFKKMCVSVCGI